MKVKPAEDLVHDLTVDDPDRAGAVPQRPIQTRWHRAATPDNLIMRIRVDVEAKRNGWPPLGLAWWDVVPMGRC